MKKTEPERDAPEIYRQMLLDRRFGDDEVGRDLAGRGRGDECLVREGGPAQRGEHVGLATGQFGSRLPAQSDLGGDVLDRSIRWLVLRVDRDLLRLFEIERHARRLAIAF